MINVTIKTLREPFHCDKKMLSSSVVCLSFTILNTFETKKGIIKILVYSSVITVKPVLIKRPPSIKRSPVKVLEIASFIYCKFDLH